MGDNVQPDPASAIERLLRGVKLAKQIGDVGAETPAATQLYLPGRLIAGHLMAWLTTDDWVAEPHRIRVLMRDYRPAGVIVRLQLLNRRRRPVRLDVTLAGAGPRDLVPTLSVAGGADSSRILVAYWTNPQATRAVAPSYNALYDSVEGCGHDLARLVDERFGIPPIAPFTA